MSCRYFYDHVCSRNENDSVTPGGPPDCALWDTGICQIMLAFGMASAYTAPYDVHYTLTVYRVQRNTARRSIPVVRKVQLTLYHGRRGRRRCRSPGNVYRYDITIRLELRHGQRCVNPIYVNPSAQGGTRRTPSLRWTRRLGGSAHAHIRLYLWQLSTSPFSLPVTSFPFPSTLQLLYRTGP